MILTPAARLVAAECLQRAADTFAGHGCNDFTLPPTPGNLAVMRGLNAWACPSKPESGPAWLSADGSEIVTQDWLAMQFCAHLLRSGVTPS